MAAPKKATAPSTSIECVFTCDARECPQIHPSWIRSQFITAAEKAAEEFAAKIASSKNPDGEIKFIAPDSEITEGMSQADLRARYRLSAMFAFEYPGYAVGETLPVTTAEEE